jgi:protein-tyrosine phosphatase
MANFSGLQMDAIRAKEEADRLAYEARTTGAMVNGYPVTIETLRKVFTEVQNPAGWKKPVCAKIHHARIKLVVEAVIFYHGVKPTVTKIDERYAMVEGTGYAG